VGEIKEGEGGGEQQGAPWGAARVGAHGEGRAAGGPWGRCLVAHKLLCSVTDTVRA
jgi:hypothetical protein